MSPKASHRVRPGLSSAASLMTTLLISFDQEVLNQHLNLVTPEYPFFESPCAKPRPKLTVPIKAHRNYRPHRSHSDDDRHLSLGAEAQARITRQQALPMILRLASIVVLRAEAAASGGISGCVSPQPCGRASFSRHLRPDRSAERTRRPSPLASRQQGRTSSTRASASEGAGSRATLRDGIGLSCGAARTRMPARPGVICYRMILIRLLWLPKRTPQPSRKANLNLSSR